MSDNDTNEVPNMNNIELNTFQKFAMIKKLHIICTSCGSTRFSYPDQGNPIGAPIVAPDGGMYISNPVVFYWIYCENCGASRLFPKFFVDKTVADEENKK